MMSSADLCFTSIQFHKNDAFFVRGARLSSHHQLAHRQASIKVPPVLQLICVMVPKQPELCVRVAFLLFYDYNDSFILHSRFNGK